MKKKELEEIIENVIMNRLVNIIEEAVEYQVERRSEDIIKAYLMSEGIKSLKHQSGRKIVESNNPNNRLNKILSSSREYGGSAFLDSESSMQPIQDPQPVEKPSPQRQLKEERPSGHSLTVLEQRDTEDTMLNDSAFDALVNNFGSNWKNITDKITK